MIDVMIDYYMMWLIILPESDSLYLVCAWHKQTPVLSAIGGTNRFGIQAANDNFGTWQRIAIGYLYQPLDASMHTLHVLDETAFVFDPFLWQYMSAGVFTTRQFQCDLKTIGVYVVEILHAAYDSIGFGRQRQTNKLRLYISAADKTFGYINHPFKVNRRRQINIGRLTLTI